MKAERDDAPEFFRQERKKESPWKLVIFLGIGSAITWVLIALFAKPIVINVDELLHSIHVDGKPLGNKETAMPIMEPVQPTEQMQVNSPPPSKPLTKPLSKAEIEWFENTKAIAVERAQNIYNDNNYTPKQPVNTYTPQTFKQVSPSSNQNQTRRVQRGRDAQWVDKWSGGGRYLAEWTTRNNYIENGSVCKNHKYGSIDYRECRKGAKQFFKAQCKNWTERYQRDRKDWSYNMKNRYCTAASSFSPMG